MPASEQLLDELAGAVLDGAAVDWAAAESSAGAAARPLVRHLRLVASIASVHRDVLPTRHSPRRSACMQAAADPDRWGHLRLARARRAWRFRRSVPRLGHAARPRSRAEAPARRAVRSDPQRRQRSFRKAGCSPRSGIRTSSPSTAPSRSAIRSACGWSSSAATRSSSCSSRARSFARPSHRDRPGAVPRRLGRARGRPAASRHQGAERDPRRGRPRRADGLRHRQGAR